MRHFQREVDEKSQGRVDMELVLWIWDEHARLYPGGRWYKETNQKRMLDEILLLEPGRIGGQFHKTIESLAARRPPDMTEGQWMSAVYWTNRLRGGCFSTRGATCGHTDGLQTKVDDMRRFQREFEQKVKGKVDMNLIFWIWDEYAKRISAGQRDEQNIEKTKMLEEIRRLEKTSLLREK
jgi:hypothetical protein